MKAIVDCKFESINLNYNFDKYISVCLKKDTQKKIPPYSMGESMLSSKKKEDQRYSDPKANIKTNGKTRGKINCKTNSKNNGKNNTKITAKLMETNSKININMSKKASWPNTPKKHQDACPAGIKIALNRNFHTYMIFQNVFNFQLGVSIQLLPSSKP